MATVSAPAADTRARRHDGQRGPSVNWREEAGVAWQTLPQLARVTVMLNPATICGGGPEVGTATSEARPDASMRFGAETSFIDEGGRRAIRHVGNAVQRARAESPTLLFTRRRSAGPEYTDRTAVYYGASNVEPYAGRIVTTLKRRRCRLRQGSSAPA
jgi:hypothetical protein